MILSVLLAVLLALSIVLCGFLIYITILRRYTKAKFAFVALGALSSLSVLIVTSLLARETPIQSLLGLVAQMRGLEYTPRGPSSVELVIICFVTFSLHSTVRRLFHDWHGPISVEERKKEIQQQHTGLVSEGLREAMRLVKRQPPSPSYVPPDDAQYIHEIHPPEDALAWHEHARDLVVLRHPTIEFPIPEGWHEQASCWVGINVRTQKTVCLCCPVDKPTEPTLSKFAEYIRRVVPEHAQLADSHFCVFRGTGDSWETEISGVTVLCKPESQLLDELVDFSDYFYDIIRRVEQDCLPESEMRLGDVYVESMCANHPILEDEEEPFAAEEALTEWEREPSSRHLALLGEYGQGKSTCALMFAYHSIRDRKFHADRVPVLIELRGKAPSTMSPDELLATWAVRFRINPVALKKLVIAGRVLLIFDGFDEMAFIGQGDTRIDHFRTIWQFAYPKAKILLTGRPNFFLDAAEMRAALGIREAVPGRPHCHALYLQPFLPKQIAAALRAFNADVQTEIPALAERNARFRDLASRPCLLYIIGVLWERRRDELSRHITSASVMDLFVEYSLDRQEAKARSGSRFMTLRPAERAFFMDGIAAHMLASAQPNQLPIRELRVVTSQLLEIIPDSVTESSDAMSGHPSKPLRARLGDDESLIEALQTDVRTYGLLVNDPTKAGTMRFAHKSFMEYLAAKVASRGIVSPEDDASAAIRNAFGIGIADITRRRETAAFFAESVASSFHTEDTDNRDTLAAPLLDILVPSRLCRRALLPGVLRLSAVLNVSRARMLQRRLKEDASGVFKEHREEIEYYVEATEKLRSIPSQSVRLYWLLTIFLVPIVMQRHQEGWRAWLDCCFELGVSPEAMARVTSDDLVPLFQYERERYLTGKPSVRSIDVSLDIVPFRFISLMLREVRFRS